MLAAMGLVVWLMPWTYEVYAAPLVVAAVVGGTNIHFAELRRKGDELRVAKEAVVEMARIAERERIGRDLHDLLGHTLSVIVLKSELASKLADRDPARAVTEIRDVERISREALSEVRKAVRGFRSEGLPDALGNAERVLVAAGVRPVLDVDGIELEADEERVLAFALREAVTNVIRHARASALLDQPAVEERARGARGERRRVRRAGAGRERPVGDARSPPSSGRHARALGRAGHAPARHSAAAWSGSRSPGMIRVLIAEDQAMVLGALAALIEIEQDLEVIGQVRSGTEALAAALSSRPDVIVTDIEMPGLSGLELAGELKRQGCTARVIILTTFARPGYLRRALDAGASGYLLKDAPSNRLADAIRRVHGGGRAVDPELAAEAWSEADPLTDRERQVLRLAADGQSGAEIAAGLELSEGTVRNYLSEAINKIGAKNRVDAARIARGKGWL